MKLTFKRVSIVLTFAVAIAAGASLRPSRADQAAPIAKASESAPLVKGVVKIGMTVSDLDASVAFYENVLSFKKISEREVASKEMERHTGVFGLRVRIAELQLGDEVIELTEYVASPGRPYPAQSRSNDRWFQHIAIITSDMDKAFATLRKAKVKFASTGPQTLPAWNKNAAGISAFYFRDPDGHVLEVLQFPADKGPERWHATGRLFLGIDHTAIVVHDTETSLTFYRDLCGFKVAGGSENYGDEQEHLNNVEGAHLRITTMRSAKGPAIEFLEYKKPTDGKAYPADERPNDIMHWQITVNVADANAAFVDFSKAAKPLGEVTLIPEAGNRDVPAFLVRDPDGHVLQIESSTK